MSEAWRKNGSLWVPPRARDVGVQQQLSHGADHDPNRIRWGDIFSITIPTSVAGAPTLQIVNARAPFLPGTWSVFLYASIVEGTIDGNLVDVTFLVTLGVGASTVTFYYTLTFDPAASTPVITPWSIDSQGQVSPLPADNSTSIYTTPTLRIPARDIQIVAITNAFLEVFPIHMSVGAWVAPFVPPSPRDTDQREHPWMGPGFHAEPLNYR
jgi:hypothetical protein